MEKRIKDGIRIFLTAVLLLVGFAFSLGYDFCEVMAQDYNLWIGNTQVTDENREDVLGDGTVTYIPATQDSAAKLLLKGMQLNTYSEQMIGNNKDEAACGIYTDHSLEIYLTGSNVLTVIHRSQEFERCYGIYQKGEGTYLRFSGDGSLLIASDQALKRSFGIRAESMIITDKVEMNVSGGSIIAGSSSEVSYSYGIYVINRISILDNARVVAVAGEANKSFGIYVQEDTLQMQNQSMLEVFGKKALSLKNNTMLQVSEDVKKQVLVNTTDTANGATVWTGDKLEDYSYVKIDAGKPELEKDKGNKGSVLGFVFLVILVILVLIGSMVIVALALKKRNKG